MIQTALIGPAQECCSHLPLEIKKLEAFCREFQKTCDNKESKTKAKLLLKDIPSASGEQIKTLSLLSLQSKHNQIEQMVKKHMSITLQI